MPLHHAAHGPPPRIGEESQVIRLHLENRFVRHIGGHLGQQPVQIIIHKHNPGMLWPDEANIDHILVKRDHMVLKPGDV